MDLSGSPSTPPLRGLDPEHMEKAFEGGSKSTVNASDEPIKASGEPGKVSGATKRTRSLIDFEADTIEELLEQFAGYLEM